MKYLLRVFLFHCFALWLVSQIIPVLSMQGGIPTLLTAGGILSVLMIFVAPMLKILFIPINIITFGLLSWCINVIVLYLLTFIMPSVSIQAWRFPGAQWGGFVVPDMQLSYGMSLILISLSVSFLVNVFHDISDH